MNARSALFGMFLVGIFGLTSAADETAPAVQVERGGECAAVVGQPVHFVFRYDGFAGEIITGLEVTIDGKRVKEPKIESRPDPKMVDVVQVFFVFRPDRAGTYQVVVTPIRGTARGKPREHVLKVAEK